MVTTISALVGLTLVAAPGQPLSLDDAFAGVTSPMDVHTAVMKATVLLFVPVTQTDFHPATGFFVWKRGADSQQRVFLVTAAHAFDGAKSGGLLLVSARHNTSRAKCDPEGWQIAMFDRKRRPLWLEHKKADIAVLEVGRDQVPCVAISVSDLATTADAGAVGLGDEVFAVGYPWATGSSSTTVVDYGLLISGRVAGYPVLNTADSATGIYFDASVTVGCSGAPLYWLRGSGGGSDPGTRRPRPVVVGVTTRVVQGIKKEDGGRTDLAVGFAALASYARELIEKAK